MEKYKFTQNTELLKENIDDGGILLYDEKMKETHILNATAGSIYKLFEIPTMVIDAFAKYKEILNLPPDFDDTVKTDFYELIDSLINKLIILRVDNEQ